MNTRGDQLIEWNKKHALRRKALTFACPYCAAPQCSPCRKKGTTRMWDAYDPNAYDPNVFVHPSRIKLIVPKKRKVTMNPLKYSKPYQEALGAFEAFRKLGFSADDIYCIVNGPLKEGPDDHIGKVQLLMQLRAQNKQFSLHCGLLNGSASAVTKKWQGLTTALREGRLKQAHLNKMWRQSGPYRQPHGFLTALLNKGFVKWYAPKATN